MKVDEEQEYAPTRITDAKKGVGKKTSDHNVFLTNFKLPWNKESTTQRNSSFNLKNKECQKTFKEATTNTNTLSKVFEEEHDLDEAVDKFLKRLNKILHKCFKKIGPKMKKNEIQEELYNRW